MQTWLQFLLNRARERSTWIGIISFLGSVGVALKPDMAEAIASTGIAIAGLIMAVTKDKAPPAA